jgi:hypothetical protein
VTEKGANALCISYDVRLNKGDKNTKRRMAQRRKRWCRASTRLARVQKLSWATRHEVQCCTGVCCCTRCSADENLRHASRHREVQTASRRGFYAHFKPLYFPLHRVRLIIILLLTYKIVASCILGLEVIQNNMHERSKMFKETRMYLLLSNASAAKTRRNLFRFYLQPRPRLSTAQYMESLL